MAVRFDNSADLLSRNTDLPNIQTLTICCWGYLTSDLNAKQDLFLVGGTNNAIYLQTAADGTTMRVGVWDGSTEFLTGTVALSLATWYFFAATLNGGATARFYYAQLADASLTVPSSVSGISMPSSSTVIYVGANGAGAERWDGRIAYAKLWSGVELTQAELEAERRTIRPQRYANLYGWWPAFPGSTERAKDYSGNGRNFTEGGTLTDEDPPPVPWGTPLSPLIVNKFPGYEQEGFRYRRDDGSETTATWRQAQDTTDSIAKLTNIRLRSIVNTTRNTPSATYTQQWRKQGSGDNAWRDIKS